MTIREFVGRLLDCDENADRNLQSGEDPRRFENPVERAHSLGLIDLHAVEHADDPITRRDAARILHIFLRDVLSVPDLKDISAAGVLRDLYDCRVCANDIAQVFCRGIMSAHEYPEGLKLFESYATLSDAEAEKIFMHLKPIIHDRGIEYRGL